MCTAIDSKAILGTAKLEFNTVTKLTTGGATVCHICACLFFEAQTTLDNNDFNYFSFRDDWALKVKSQSVVECLTYFIFLVFI